MKPDEKLFSAYTEDHLQRPRAQENSPRKTYVRHVRKNGKVPAFDILLELNKTLSTSEIAKQYDICGESVRRYFRIAGIKPLNHRWHKLPTATELARMNQTMTLREIAKELDVGITTIRRHLISGGFACVNHMGRPRPELVKHPIKKIKQFIREGYNAREIAEIMGTTAGTIESSLHRHGLAIKKIRGLTDVGKKWVNVGFHINQDASREIEITAKKLGISKSELIRRAIRDYLIHINGDNNDTDT